MTPDAAMEELTFHCGSNPHTDDPRWNAGFLQQLHPYRGQLPEAAYQRLTMALDALKDQIQTAPAIDRRIVNSVWAICHWSRQWHLNPEGEYFQTTNLRSDDRRTLAAWIDGLSHKLALWLDQNDA